MATAKVLSFPEATHTSAPVTQLANIADRTVFLRVGFSLFGISRKVDAEVNTEANAGLLKVSKMLLDSSELEEIRKADTLFRTRLKLKCLPFDTGILTVPVGMIGTVEAMCQQHAIERKPLEQAFYDAYPALCDKAAKELKELYRAADYPSVEDLKSRFGFTWQYVSFSVPGHLKNVSPAIFEEQTKKTEAMFAEAGETITLLMRETMLQMVTHLRDRLTPSEDGKPKKLFASAVENLREFLNTFDLRNVTDDTELAAVVDKAKGFLTGVNVEALREAEGYKDTVRTNMAEIAAALGNMVEAKGRKFRD